MPLTAGVNPEFLAWLELTSDKIFPLPGSTGSSLAKDADQVTYYEHIATVYHRLTKQFFVAFRRTSEAFQDRHAYPSKYPELLMKMPQKQTERAGYIYKVTQHPSQVKVLRTHEDWLTPISDVVVFETISYFLTKKKIINQVYMVKKTDGSQRTEPNRVFA